MTDGKMVSTMARIYRLVDQIQDLMEGDLFNHPNGEALCGELHDNGLGYRIDCASIAQSHLLHPKRWEYVDGGTLKYKAAEAAGGDGETDGSTTEAP